MNVKVLTPDTDETYILMPNRFTASQLKKEYGKVTGRDVSNLVVVYDKKRMKDDQELPFSADLTFVLIKFFKPDRPVNNFYPFHRGQYFRVDSKFKEFYRKTHLSSKDDDDNFPDRYHFNLYNMRRFLPSRMSILRDDPFLDRHFLLLGPPLPLNRFMRSSEDFIDNNNHDHDLSLDLDLNDSDGNVDDFSERLHANEEAVLREDLFPFFHSNDDFRRHFALHEHHEDMEEDLEEDLEEEDLSDNFSPDLIHSLYSDTFDDAEDEMVHHNSLNDFIFGVEEDVPSDSDEPNNLNEYQVSINGRIENLQFHLSPEEQEIVNRLCSEHSLLGRLTILQVYDACGRDLETTNQCLATM